MIVVLLDPAAHLQQLAALVKVRRGPNNRLIDDR